MIQKIEENFGDDKMVLCCRKNYITESFYFVCVKIVMEIMWRKMDVLIQESKD